MKDTATITELSLRAPKPDEKLGWQDRSVPGGPRVYENTAIGVIVYGIGKLGYDQWLIGVKSGSPVLGYCFIDGELHLTALLAGRPNLNDGQIGMEVAGGFAKADIASGERTMPKTGALRELFEETGFAPEDVIFADGLPFVGDRAFFYKEPGDGNNVFYFELQPEHIVHVEMSPNLRLVHWTEFVKESVDGITLSSIARVMASLATAGKLTVTEV